MTVVVLRPATLDDVDAIAHVHVAAWRIAYRDLAPPEAKAAITEEVRRVRWRAMLTEPAPDQLVLVAMDGAACVGFGLARRPVEPVFGGRGEVSFLYVAPDRQGQGIGRRLLGALARHLAARGYTGLALGVVQGNERAVRFYTRLGARSVGHYRDPGPIWPSSNDVYAWDDIGALTAMPGEPIRGQ